LAAMQLCLASNVFVSEGVSADISDLDPLSFAGAPSSPTDVAQSSQGVAVAGDPVSENVSSPVEVGDVSIQLNTCSQSNKGVPADVRDPDPLAFADAPSPHPADFIRSSQGVAAAGDPGSKNVSSPTEVGSSGSVYRPEWGVTNGSLLDTPEACQDLVDHAAPPGYFSELRHMHNDDFLRQYNIN
nr:hypothetical protein [Tanacetum cinerariifolium]